MTTCRAPGVIGDHIRAGPQAMLSAASALLSRFTPADGISRREAIALCIIATLHAAALIIMTATEVDLVAKIAFLFAWALLNFFWLAVLRRPIASALLSLAFIICLILLSRFKHDKLWMTVDFVDLMIIDRDTSAFLLTAMPSLRMPVTLAAAILAALLTIGWRLDPFRARLRVSIPGGTFCISALAALSLSFPTELYEDFFSQNYVSKFARTGVEAIYEVMTHGYLESDATVRDQLKAPLSVCSPG